jgi:Flp pilus assembly protein TadG
MSLAPRVCGGRGGKRDGIAATEFALTLPLIVCLFLGTTDFCRVFYYSQTLQACANTGVLFASRTARPPSGTASSDAAVNAAMACGAGLSPTVQAANITVQSTGAVSTVTVTCTFQPLVAFPGMPGSIELVRTATATLAPLNPGETR